MTDLQIAELKRHAQTNTYVAHGDITKVDCVIGFSFGFLETEDGVRPGKSNVQLAKFIETNFSGKPLILQFEINDALSYQTAALVITESRQKGEYLNSKEIAEQAIIFMKKHGWQTAAIVTHPGMEARNDALCSKLGIVTVIPEWLHGIEYDSDSAQDWTRNKDAWWKREEKVIEKCVEEGWI